MSWKEIKKEASAWAANPLRPFEYTGEQLGLIGKKKDPNLAPTPPGYAEQVAAGNVAADEWLRNVNKERETYLNTLLGQQRALEEAPAQLAKQREEALQALRYNLAQAASQGRGLLGGGAGLAATRQFARERGVGEGETRSQFTQAEMEARQRAAAAASEVSAERDRLLQLQRQDTDLLNEALATIRAIKGGSASKGSKVNELRALRDAAVDPRIRAVYTQAINQW